MAYGNIININLGFNMNNIVTITQYSTGNRFNFYLNDYTIPDNADVKIYVKKPSGHEVLCDCIYSNNVITSPCTIQMVAELGDSNSQIQIFENGEYLCSFKFTIHVTENIYAAMRIESSDEYRTLEDLIMSASYIIEQVNKQEADRVEQEEIRQTNEGIREKNEETRKKNETSRKNAEKSRETKEGERQDQEDIRKRNEDKRIENEGIREGNESVRETNEIDRINAFAKWQDAISGYVRFEERITHLENPDKAYVPLNSNEIIRGTYDKDSDLYTRGCKMEYDPSIEGMVISFI